MSETVRPTRRGRGPGSNRWESPAGYLITLLLAVGVAAAAASYLYRPMQRWLSPAGGKMRAWLPQDNDPRHPRSVFLFGGPHSDPAVEIRYRPHSRMRDYYPTNPRKYFDEEPTWLAGMIQNWRLHTEDGTEAGLEVCHSRDELCLAADVTILPDGAPSWSAILSLVPQPFEPGSRIDVRLRARADRPRSIEIVVSFQGVPQENTLRVPIELGNEWQEFRQDYEFPRISHPATARVYCNLAGHLGPVYFTQLEVRVLPPGVLPGTAAADSVRPDGVDPNYLYFIEYEMNLDGFRERECTVEKDPGVFRIACLGDSFTYGTGVRAGERWTEKLEAQLNSSSTRPAGVDRYEVLNFGIPGYGTREELRLYEEVVRSYQADLVVLMMCWNDHVPLNEEFALAERIREQGQDPGMAGDRSNAYIEALTALYRSTSFDVCLKELRGLDAACHRDGARLVVGVFNVNAHLDWDRLIENLNEHWRGPWLELGPALKQAGLFGDPGLVHACDGHPNQAAHQVAGRELAKFLDSRDLLQPAIRNAR